MPRVFQATLLGMAINWASWKANRRRIEGKSKENGRTIENVHQINIGTSLQLGFGGSFLLLPIGLDIVRVEQTSRRYPMTNT